MWELVTIITPISQEEEIKAQRGSAVEQGKLNTLRMHLRWVGSSVGGMLPRGQGKSFPGLAPRCSWRLPQARLTELSSLSWKEVPGRDSALAFPTFHMLYFVMDAFLLCIFTLSTDAQRYLFPCFILDFLSLSLDQMLKLRWQSSLSGSPSAPRDLAQSRCIVIKVSWFWKEFLLTLKLKEKKKKLKTWFAWISPTSLGPISRRYSARNV